ncbi:MAG: helicase [Bacteroidales bacterium 45-6]|jgi:ERCC4-related helicase|nr:MAG: helicase [Bacteroidales bacterium 45-6]
MKILDNKQGRTVENELSQRIDNSTIVSISTGMFSIYAFYLLREKMKHIKGLNILLLTNPQTNKANGVSIAMDNSFWGATEEGELKRQLLLRTAAEECSRILERSHIRALKVPNAFGFKLIFVEKENEGCVIHSGMADFSADTLGFIGAKNPQQHILQDGNNEVVQLKQIYDQTWTDSTLTKEITKLAIEELKKGYRDYSPDSVYYMILHHLFHYSIVDFADDKIFKSKTGFKEKEIWKKLYKFQKDGVMGAIEKIEKYGGCIIADSVGLGKTFEALAVIKYYELRNDRVLVLCPKKLRDNWTVYTQNDKRNILINDRFNYDVLCHTDLTRLRGKSGDIDLAAINWANYDLVVIDESHNFRNNYPSKGEMTRYSRLMNEVITKGVKTKLLMLSATPVNNRMNDLKNQISFITEGEDTVFEDEGIDNISHVMKLAQRQFSDWAKTSDRNINLLFDRLDNRYFKLLDMLTIARSRKHIVKYYDSADVGRFPTRLRPINEKTDIDSQRLFPSLRNINNAIRKLNLANYSPVSSLKEEKKAEYAAKYDYQLSTGSVFTQSDREKNLVDLMRVNYLKRMESSIYSFYLSVKALLEQVNQNLYKIEHISELSDKSITIDNVDIEEDESDYLIGNKVKVLLQDIDLVKWRQELEYDRDTLTKLMESAATISAARDEKLTRLKEVIARKIENPINEDNKKVIVFTAFADTATYLYQELSEWILDEYGLFTALIKGSGTNKTNFPDIERKEMNELLTHFSPYSKERDKTYPNVKREIDLLIATDCISEGQNLQDCDYLVNYDIHWNPVRIIQRFGRIDRLGSKNEQIQLVNFWPNMELNEYINLESRVKGKMVLLDISATGEENLIEMNENDEMTDLEYRRKQLEQLQSTVLDLEDIQGGITITDTNMNDFRMDIMEYEKNHLVDLQNIPLGIHTVVEIDDEEIPPGTIFCMRSSVQQKGQSLLAPYYLVYMGEGGEPVLGYMQGKRCLDYLKKLCQGKTEVLAELAQNLKKETKNYANMKAYSSAFQLAIESVIGKSQEVGAASFFSTELVSLNAEGVTSQSDFDIVAFVVVKRK